MSTATVDTREAVPAEVRGWNWGAFFLNWIWAFVHRLWWQGILALIPLVGVIMMFVLGAKGNEWAWEKGDWRNVEHFKKSQRAWTIAGLALFGLGVLLVVLSVALG